jgi:hypothetical protein
VHVKYGRVAVSFRVEQPSRGLPVRRDRGLVSQSTCTGLGTLPGQDGQMARRAERTLATWPTVARPVRRQPCQRTGPRAGKRMHTVAHRDWTTTAPAVPPSSRAAAPYPARHRPCHRVLARWLHAQRGAGRPHRLAGARTDVDADEATWALREELVIYSTHGRGHGAAAAAIGGPSAASDRTAQGLFGVRHRALAAAAPESSAEWPAWGAVTGVSFGGRSRVVGESYIRRKILRANQRLARTPQP